MPIPGSRYFKELRATWPSKVLCFDATLPISRQAQGAPIVRVEGHTDWVGDDATNQKLLDRRAMAVRDYLIQKGIEPDRLDEMGFGEGRPIADNHTERGRALNRRTEFIIVR